MDWVSNFINCQNHRILPGRTWGYYNPLEILLTFDNLLLTINHKPLLFDFWKTSSISLSPFFEPLDLPPCCFISCFSFFHDPWSDSLLRFPQCVPLDNGLFIESSLHLSHSLSPGTPRTRSEDSQAARRGCIKPPIEPHQNQSCLPHGPNLHLFLDSASSRGTPSFPYTWPPRNLAESRLFPPLCSPRLHLDSHFQTLTTC